MKTLSQISSLQTGTNRRQHIAVDATGSAARRHDRHVALSHSELDFGFQINTFFVYRGEPMT